MNKLKSKDEIQISNPWKYCATPILCWLLSPIHMMTTSRAHSTEDNSRQKIRQHISRALQVWKSTSLGDQKCQKSTERSHSTTIWLKTRCAWPRINTSTYQHQSCANSDHNPNTPPLRTAGDVEEERVCSQTGSRNKGSGGWVTKTSFLTSRECHLLLLTAEENTRGACQDAETQHYLEAQQMLFVHHMLQILFGIKG